MAQYPAPKKTTRLVTGEDMNAVMAEGDDLSGQWEFELNQDWGEALYEADRRVREQQQG